MALHSGVLIAFEGIDGSGKSTGAVRLAAWARQRGLDVVATKEPTEGAWGQRIRASRFSARMAPEEELECFLKDRREHVETLIGPALARGALVIVDRYFYSTAAYQGARGLDVEEILRANRAFAPEPDLVFLFDVAPQAGLSRIHHRGAGQDLFETLEALTEVRKIFKAITGPNFVTIDSSQSSDETFAAVMRGLEEGPLRAWLASLS